MSDAVVMVGIIVIGLVLATLGVVAIVFGKNVSASLTTEEAKFRADGGAEKCTPKVGSAGRNASRAV